MIVTRQKAAIGGCVSSRLVDNRGVSLRRQPTQQSEFTGIHSVEPDCSVHGFAAAGLCDGPIIRPREADSITITFDSLNCDHSLFMVALFEVLIFVAGRRNLGIELSYIATGDEKS